MKKELICINCPMGCNLTAEVDEAGKVISVSGNTCVRGKSYAETELTHPKRTVTALCPVSGSEVPLSVKSDKPIDKQLIFPCLAVIASNVVTPPVRIGQILIENILGTDVNIVATQQRE